MDSSSSASASSPNSQPHNWLAFSLSNHFPSSTSPPHLQPDLSLFHSFPSSGGAQEVVEATTTTTATTATLGGATDLSMFTSVPKLEDFLGGSTTSTTTTPAAAPPLSHLPADSTLTLSDADIYGSELKTLAASFLRGYVSTEQSPTQKPLQLQLPSLSATAATLPDLPLRKTADTFGQRTSIYRGVTRHRWTGRYEAHLWDNSCRREGQSRKGRQVYLGGYDKEDKAARAYDLAALKYWGPTTTTNFSISNYERELDEMKNMTRQEFVASLRRKSSGFSRGASIYRGVTRHHQHGRWQARIGRVAGNKDLYLGTFSTQEEAAEAYDIAAIKFRGLNAVTNFDISRYNVKSIANSNLPIGGLSNKSKNHSEFDCKSQEGSESDETRDLSSSSVSFASHPSRSTLSFALPIKQDPSDYWSVLGYLNQNPSVNNAKSYTSVAQTLSQSSSSNVSLLPSSITTPFNIEYSVGSENNSDNNGYLNNGGMFSQQQHTSSSTARPNFATPITTLSSNNGYEGSSSYENWIGPSFHTFQPHAKPSLFQTPIFGME